MVGGGEEGAVAAVGGVGRLPRIRVSRSALSVVGGPFSPRRPFYEPVP